MPRRRRPPLTAREIAAYLSGGRAAREVGYTLLTAPELEHLALLAAQDDYPIAASMELADYLSWYYRGYWAEVSRAAAE